MTRPGQTSQIWPPTPRLLLRLAGGCRCVREPPSLPVPGSRTNTLALKPRLGQPCGTISHTPGRPQLALINHAAVPTNLRTTSANASQRRRMSFDETRCLAVMSRLGIHLEVIHTAAHLLLLSLPSMRCTNGRQSRLSRVLGIGSSQD